MQHLPPTKQMRPMIQREFRGINTLDPFSIEPSFATVAKNLTSAKYPAATTRPGYSLLGTFGTRVLGMGVWKNRELHAVFNDGTWRRMNTDGSWTQLASGLSTTAEWTFCNYLGDLADINLIASNGVDPVKRYDGTSVQNLTGAPTGAKYITVYQYRLWCIVGNEIWATAVDQASNWTEFDGGDDDAYRRQLESPIGEEANTLASGLSKLVIGFDNEIDDLFGGVPSDFRVKPVTYDVGFVNNKSHVTFEGTLYLYDKRGFYRYGGGMLPSKSYSTVVQGIVDRANATARRSSSVGTDGQRILFSIPSNGAEDPDTILEYDPRGGVETWYLWEDIRALFFVRMGDNLYIGDAQGRILRLGGVTDGGKAIPWEWVSKPFTGDTMAHIVRWIRMWVSVSLPTGSTFNVSISNSVDGDDWTLLKSFTPSSGVQRERIEIPSTVAAKNAGQLRVKFHGTGPMTLYEWSPEVETLPPR